MVPRYLFNLILLGFLLPGCTQATLQATQTQVPTGVIKPYRTNIPSPISPTVTQIIIIPVTPVPTPTPFMHTVKKGETMLGIAFQYGVSLEDLKAANPGVDPNFLSIGIQLIIPISGEITESVPTPPPVQVDWKQPLCYRTGDGGSWCILSVRNGLETSVEDISAWVGLYTPQGENISSQVAYPALNRLRPGETIPVMSYFSPPLPEEFQAHAELLSGLAVAAADTRYLDLETTEQKVDISTDGTQALVSGEVILPSNTPFPSQLWVLIVAYDSNGDIIGARKWESSGEAQFALPVYALAGKIDRVEVLTEGRP